MDNLIFPYITGIKVNDCYAAKNFFIPVFEENEKFRHLILTGKNGSGKTTILKKLDEIWTQLLKGFDYFETSNSFQHLLENDPNNIQAKSWEKTFLAVSYTHLTLPTNREV